MIQSKYTHTDSHIWLWTRFAIDCNANYSVCVTISCVNSLIPIQSISFDEKLWMEIDLRVESKTQRKREEEKQKSDGTWIQQSINCAVLIDWFYLR